MQSFTWGEVMKHKNFEPHYVVMKDNDDIVASALMLKKNLFKGYCYYYIPRGFMLDYHNDSILEEFTTYLTKYAKNNKAIYVKIDPDIKLHTLDGDGNIIGEGNFNMLLAFIYYQYGANKVMPVIYPIVKQEDMTLSYDCEVISGSSDYIYSLPTTIYKAFWV